MHHKVNNHQRHQILQEIHKYQQGKELDKYYLLRNNNPQYKKLVLSCRNLGNNALLYKIYKLIIEFHHCMYQVRKVSLSLHQKHSNSLKDKDNHNPMRGMQVSKMLHPLNIYTHQSNLHNNLQVMKKVYQKVQMFHDLKSSNFKMRYLKINHKACTIYHVHKKYSLSQLVNPSKESICHLDT